jgi:hypothetical protein
MKEQISKIIDDEVWPKASANVDTWLTGVENAASLIHNLFIQKQVEVLTLLMDSSQEYESVVRFEDIQDLIQTLKKELK